MHNVEVSCEPSHICNTLTVQSNFFVFESVSALCSHTGGAARRSDGVRGADRHPDGTGAVDDW
jgi:hypothetical protein